MEQGLVLRQTLQELKLSELRRGKLYWHKHQKEKLKVLIKFFPKIHQNVSKKLYLSYRDLKVKTLFHLWRAPIRYPELLILKMKIRVIQKEEGKEYIQCLENNLKIRKQNYPLFPPKRTWTLKETLLEQKKELPKCHV